MVIFHRVRIIISLTYYPQKKILSLIKKFMTVMTLSYCKIYLVSNQSFKRQKIMFFQRLNNLKWENHLWRKRKISQHMLKRQNLFKNRMIPPEKKTKKWQNKLERLKKKPKETIRNTITWVDFLLVL